MPLRLTIQTAPPGEGPDGAGVAPAGETGHGAPGSRSTPAEVVIDGESFSLGRGTSVDLRLPAPAMSLRHAVIERAGDDWYVTDAGSTNGTRLNDARLTAGARRPLRPGDRLEVPGFLLTISDSQGPATPAATTQEVAREMVHQVLAALGHQEELSPSLSGSAAGLAPLSLREIGRTYLIGRGETCDLRLHDPNVSREHAAVRRDAAGVTLIDLGAKNGVAVDGEGVVSSCRLVDGAVVTLGSTSLSYRDPADAYLRELEDGPEVVMPLPPTGVAGERRPTGTRPATAPRRRVGLSLAVGAAVMVGLAAVVALVLLLRSP